MRSFTLLFRAALLLLLSVSGLPEASAQFDEEFDEFDDPEPEPEEQGVAAAGFGEFDDDAFAEEPEPTPNSGDLEQDDAFADDLAAAEEENEAPTAEDEEADPREFPADERRFQLGSTFLGTTGGFHVPHALGAPAGTFRVQLALEFMTDNGFLFPEDGHSRVGGTAALSVAVHKWVELYASLQSYATSNNREFPNLLIVLGDVRLGAKVGLPITDALSVGGDFSFLLPTGSGLGPSLSGIGFALRANATLDLRERQSSIPLIARLSLGYTFDQSANLIEEDENRRFERLSDPDERGSEIRHLITRPERNALSISRLDFFNIGIGLEAPIEISDDIVLSPILEYSLGIPVNRQNYTCAFIPAEAGGTTPAEGQDGCLFHTGFAAFPQILTLGARLLPPVRGFSLLAALDIGLTGTRSENAVRELSQTAPWKLWVGFGYAHDTRDAPIPDPVVREVERTVEVPADVPPSGRIIARVLEERQAGQDEDTPIAGATIFFEEPVMTALRATDEGRFTTYAFPPGVVRMRIEASMHAPGQCEGTIGEEGGDLEILCRLERVLVAVEEEQVVILEQIQFAFDSDEILEESFGLMGQIAGALISHPELSSIEIQGHTDDQGDDQYNAMLSQRRAESVQAWLVENGVPAGRLRARGYGETVPLVHDTTEEARERNRRVEFRILGRSE